MRQGRYQLPGDFILENGKQLRNPVVAYHTFGKLNARRDNVIWVCHALTANSNVFEWWPGLFGANDLFNGDDHFIICANMLGSHYGTTGPLSINPTSGNKYYHTFPTFTIRDLVGLQQQLADHLGVRSIKLILGGSMGGQQALEWSIREPDRFENAAFIATNAVHSPWGAAFNESQRMSIEVDPTWPNNQDDAGLDGMQVARSIALLSYRNYQTYTQSQRPSSEELTFPDRAPSYQRYQGEKLAKRFNAYSYWYLSKAMDSHNVGKGRNGVENALLKIKAKTLVLTLEHDVLFPEVEQQRISQGIPGATHHKVYTNYGHDGFLIETGKIANILEAFLSHITV